MVFDRGCFCYDATRKTIKFEHLTSHPALVHNVIASGLWFTAGCFLKTRKGWSPVVSVLPLFCEISQNVSNMENRSVWNAWINLFFPVSPLHSSAAAKQFYGSWEGKWISSQLCSGLTCCFCTFGKNDVAVSVKIIALWTQHCRYLGSFISYEMVIH